MKKNYLLKSYMTEATEEQQLEIINDVKIYYRVITEMYQRGELGDDMLREKITVSEMFESTKLINETISNIGEQSTVIIAYDAILECIDEALALLS